MKIKNLKSNVFLWLSIFFSLCASSASLVYGDYENRNLKFVSFHVRNLFVPIFYHCLPYSFLLQNPPYDNFTRGPNNTFTYKGASLNIVKWMAEKLKFSYTIVPINESLVEKYGTHEASFYQLLNDNVSKKKIYRENSR